MGQQRRLRAKSLYSIVAGVVLFVLASAAPAGAATWTARQLPAMGQAPFFGISCPSVSLCVAVGAGNTVASSADPSAGAAAWSAVNPGGSGLPNQNEIKGVSCPSPQLCVAVSFEGLILTSTDPTGGVAAWSIADLNPSGPNTHFYSVSCPSPSFCVAVGDDGDEIRPGPTDVGEVLSSTDPLAGTWQQAQLPGVPGNLFSASPVPRRRSA